jgi:hypothetical protein
MKKAVWSGLVVFGALLCMSSIVSAAECSGSWQVMKNYNPGAGGPCAALGLNTHQPVCQPGQRYATYCDDASGGRYRTCQSNVPCDRESSRGGDERRYRERSDDYRDDYRDDRRDYRDRNWDNR